MAKLTNAPTQVLQMDLERRKSYAFRLAIKNEQGDPADLTGCTIRFVLKPDTWDDDQYDMTNLLVNSQGQIGSGAEARNGVAMFSFQAAELDGDPGTYYGSLVLWTATGYSTTLAKLQVRLLENTESDSIHYSFDSAAPPSEIEATLRGQQVVNLIANNISTTTITRGPCLRTTSVTIDGQPGQVTNLAHSAIDDVTYQTGGFVELAVGDLVVQTGVSNMVMARIMSVGNTTIQVVTIVGPD